MRSYLDRHGLKINPERETYFQPGDGFVFLGFYCSETCVDIAPVTLKKLGYRSLVNAYYKGDTGGIDTK